MSSEGRTRSALERSCRLVVALPELDVTRRLAAVVGYVVLVGLGAAACSALVDTSGLTSGGEGASGGSEDGGVGTSDAAAIDGGGDGGEGGVAVPVDAGPCDEVDATARTFCQQYSADWGYAYCRDFDDQEPIAFGWDKMTAAGGASVVLDECRRTSLPASLRSRLEANMPACSTAVAEKTVAVGASFRVAVSVRLRSVTSAAGYLGLRLGAGCHLELSGDGAAGSVIEQSGTTVAHPLNLRFPLPDAWTRVWLDIDRTNNTMNVQLDRKATTSAPVPLGAGCATTGDVTIELGLQCVSPGSAPQEVLFDDLVVTGGP
jgi:hypothetical protein